MTVKWLKQTKQNKTKLLALPKFGSPRGITSASLKIGEILAIRKNVASF